MTHNTILTITGSDSTGGSGVQADIKTISALGGYAVSAITSITVQNTLGIQEFFDLPADIVSGQIAAIIDDVEPEVVKIGMVRNIKVLSEITEALYKYRPKYIVYDPIVTSSLGEMLMSEDIISTVKTMIMPLCTLIIIKKEDAGLLIGQRLRTNEDMRDGARKLLRYGCKAVMIQSGENDDVIAINENDGIKITNSPSLNRINAHGLGNSLSSAIATYLGQEMPIGEAIEHAKTYINQQIVAFSDLKGRSSELYNEFMSEVSAHYMTHSDVRFYADRLNVSSRYLAQVTKRIANKAPKTLIDDYLISESKVMLNSTDKTVQEIAYALGFNSQSHFAKFFKKIEGITPSNYRKNQ